jgi:hypothetical protein
MPGNSDLTDIMVHQHAETKLAILVSDDGDERRAVRIPKSQIEIAPNPATVGSRAIVLVTAPAWLLESKGLA